VKVALVNLPLIEKQIPANIENVKRVIADSKNNEIDLYVFPENNICGGFWKGFSHDLDAIHQNFPFNRVEEEIAWISKEFNTGICCGYIEKEKGIYITHFICNKGTSIGKQRKLYPQNSLKEKYLESGKEIVTIKYNGYRIHILACCNFSFPEVAVMSCIQQPDMIICPADTYSANEREINVVSTYLKTRALDSGAYVLCSFGNSRVESKKLISSAAYNGKGEQLLFRIKDNNVTQISVVKFELSKAKQVCGGSSMRKDVLLNYLQSSTGAHE